MPPKKKKGGKKSGKKKSAPKSASKSPSTKIADIFNEVSKEFYLVQIRDLELKISRYQEKCDKLELRNTEVEANYEQQALDKKEIVSFLKKQLEQRSDEIADLQEKVISLQQHKDLEKNKYELEITTLKAQMQEVKDQLTSENMVLGGKLASLEEFRIQKEDLLNQFADMEELLKSQELNHKEHIYQLERKAVVDKDRLKKEMVLRVNTVAAEFRKVSNKQMAETTKRTIRENVMINSQLSKMSDKTMELISESDEIRVKEKTQKQHIDILEDNEKELMKKNATNQKIIRMLTDKTRDQEDILLQFQEKEVKFQELEKEFEKLKEELHNIQTAEKALQGEKRNLEGECSTLEMDKKQLEEDKEYLVGILSDATSVIKQALQHNDESGDPALTEMKNTNLLHKVIEILNLAVQMGIGIDPQELSTKRKTVRVKKQKVNLGPPVVNKSSCTQRGMLSSTKPLAHYKLGDLGLVPASTVEHGFIKSTGYIDNKKFKRNKEKATFYTDEQLAKGTPRPSAYELVKGNSGFIKLPVLMPIT